MSSEVLGEHPLVANFNSRTRCDVAVNYLMLLFMAIIALIIADLGINMISALIFEDTQTQVTVVFLGLMTIVVMQQYIVHYRNLPFFVRILHVNKHRNMVLIGWMTVVLAATIAVNQWVAPPVADALYDNGYGQEPQDNRQVKYRRIDTEPNNTDTIWLAEVSVRRFWTEGVLLDLLFTGPVDVVNTTYGFMEEYDPSRLLPVPQTWLATNEEHTLVQIRSTALAIRPGYHLFVRVIARNEVVPTNCNVGDYFGDAYRCGDKAIVVFE